METLTEHWLVRSATKRRIDPRETVAGRKGIGNDKGTFGGWQQLFVHEDG